MNKAEFLHLAQYSRKFTPEDIFFSGSGMDFPDLGGAAIALVESGDVAWGIPEFEQAIFSVLDEWLHDGSYIKVRLYAGWLAATTEGKTKGKLEDYADGFYYPYLRGWGTACGVVGTTVDYLYPLNLNRLVQAQLKAIERGDSFQDHRTQRDPMLMGGSS